MLMIKPEGKLRKRKDRRERREMRLKKPKTRQRQEGHGAIVERKSHDTL